MRKLLFLMCLGVLFAAAPAVAEPITDYYNAEANSAGEVLGGGDGYDMGTWYYYEETDWWNQWFYDHPPLPGRSKEIEAGGILYASDSSYGDGFATVAINYTTENYSDPTSPPLPPGNDNYIVREQIWSGTLEWIVEDVGGIPEMFPVEQEYLGGALIPDYNPEWVSIDIRGYNFFIDGWITHECIPEPATLSLLAIGALALIRRRRR